MPASNDISHDDPLSDIGDLPLTTAIGVPSNFHTIQISSWGRSRGVTAQGITTEEFEKWWFSTPWAAGNVGSTQRKIQWDSKKKHAEFWVHFELIAREFDGHPFVYCKRCTHVLNHPAIKNIGTNAIRRHLESKQCNASARKSGEGPIDKFIDELTSTTVYPR